MKRVILMTAIGALLILFQLSVLGVAAVDPSDNIPSARVIGIGRAFYGLADDTASIYTNPAGLGTLKSWGVSSLSGSFLDEFNYLSGSIAYPSQWGVFGLGYTGTSVDGGPVTTIAPGTSGGTPVYVIDPTAGSLSNSNNLIILAYGSRVDRFISLGKDIPALANLKVGAGLKIFSNSVSGSTAADSSGTGMDLNVGLLTEPMDWLSIGITGKNVLPASMGGKIVYGDDYEEAYPASIIAGAAVRILGRENALSQMGDHQLILLEDISKSNQSNAPVLAHLGLEYKPLELLSLRIGLDQDAAGDETETNMSAGVGIGYKGFRFDYGYHEFASAPGVSNSYMSLSYSSPVTAPVKKVKVAKVIKKINLTQFKDVDDDDWAFWPISLLATQGVIKGYPNGEFRPDGKITRAEMATLLVRVADVQVLSGKHIFKDVSSSFWAYDYIYTAAKNGIVTGYPGNVFRAKNSVNRAEGLVMISRFDKTPFVEYKDDFIDVAADYWAAKYLTGAKQAGLIDYIKGEKFQPKKALTRAEAAEILYRAMKVRKILKEGILKGLESQFDEHLKGTKVLGVVTRKSGFWELEVK